MVISILRGFRASPPTIMTIQLKYKKCNGTGKAKGSGCQTMTLHRTYGLCIDCFRIWLLTTPEGQAKLSKTRIRAKKQVEKNNKPKRKYFKWYEKDYSGMMQHVQKDIVNVYIKARDINKNYRCISSNGVIEHAGHYYSVGSCPGLRFEISNIHGQSAMANVHLHGDAQNYKVGLINRYGKAYFEKLESLKIKANNTKQLDKDEVVRIGKTYEWLLKNKVWCFEHDEFENYKNIINK